MPRRLMTIVGVVVATTGVAMIVAAVVSLAYGEWSTAGWIGLAAVVSTGCGGGVARWAGRVSDLTPKEAFAAVGVAWLAAALFGMLPYLFTATFTNVTDAFFETTAGYTTTGSTQFGDPSILPHGILIWRALTQWLGGMGIIVLSVALLPLVGASGAVLARAELPGGEPERLFPRFADTARRIWLFYVAFTGAEFLLLAGGDMSLFQAAAHSLTTMATGGFSTEPTSIAAFSPYTKWVIVGFMLIAGTSFALHVRAVRHPGVYARNGEFRYYTALVVGVIVLISAGLLADARTVGNPMLDSVFTAVSFITTTGYATANWVLWPWALQVLLLALMLIGAMSGSTSGALKTAQAGILSSAAVGELRRLSRPKAVVVTWFSGEPVPDSVVRNVQAFFLFYIAAFLGGAFLLAFLDLLSGGSMGFITALSASAAAIGNFGPGLGGVGPAGSYADIAWSGKWVLSFLMILGRLEIFPILLLFTRSFWRR